MTKRVVNRNRRGIGTTQPIPIQDKNAKVVVQRKQRDPSFKNLFLKNPNDELYNQIQDFTNNPEYDYYLGFGGVGDALLVLASAWNNPRAKIVFFANPGSLIFTRQFFELFELDHFTQNNIMGQTIANKIYNLMKKSPNFKTSAHLADGLYYGDWENENKYIPRIVKYVPWKNKLGIKKHNKKTLVICPSGSDRSWNRQRYLTREEYNLVRNNYLSKDWIVYTIGSENDYDFYKPRPQRYSYWLSSLFIRDKSNTRIKLIDMLKIINGADEIISVDTWLKTYALLLDLPVKIVRTRWNGKYKPYGKDSTDYIFLNKKIWPKINFFKVGDLI